MEELGAITIHVDSEDFSTDKLWVRELRGREEISQLFSFDLHLHLLPGDLPFDSSKMVSSNVSIIWRRREREVHRVRGMIANVRERLDTKTDYRVCVARVVPRAFRLSLVETSEVFLETSVPDIIKEKLSRVGLTGDAVEMRLEATYPKRPYVLQYKESDLAFVSRLAEHVGIAFHFTDGGKVGDKIIFTDDPSAFRQSSRDLYTGVVSAGEQVHDLESTTRVVPAAYMVNDYDDDNPRLDLQRTYDLEHGYGGGIVEHAPNYLTPEEGARFAQIRAEGIEARRVVYTGRSNSPTVSVGSHVRVGDTPLVDDPSMLVTSVEHLVVQATGELGSLDAASPYTNRFEGVRASIPFRPERRTPRPVVTGLLVGFVTDYLAEGPYGAVDAKGMYTVRLHLDTAPHPKAQSLPIRMIQAHAGSHYGAHMPLRAGTEVMVAFLAGDPDRPVIVGSVPNKLTQSPVNSDNLQINKILKTETGIVIEARDLIPGKGGALQQSPTEG